MLLQILSVGGRGLMLLTDGDGHFHTWTPSPAPLELFWDKTQQLLCGVYAKPWLLHDELSFWHCILMEKLQNEHSCLPAQDPGCCSLAGFGGLTVVVLGHGSSPAESKTSNQPIFIPLRSSWRSKVWLLSSTGAFELPLSWSCKGQAGATYPQQLLGPWGTEQQKKMIHCRQKGLQRKVEKSWIKSSCCSKVFSKEHFLTNTKHWSDLQYFFIVANISNFDVKCLNVSSAGRFRSRTQQPCMPIPLPPSIFVAYVQNPHGSDYRFCRMFCLWQQNDFSFNSWCLSTPREENSAIIWKRIEN